MAFFNGDRPAREPLLNAPPTVLWLIALLLATHALRVFLPGSWPDDIIENYAFIPARYAAALAQGASTGEFFHLAITIVSYMFLHGDFVHVGINSLWLLVFGPIVTRRLGTVRFLAFFLFCGIAAALVHLAFYWGSPMAVVGASGGVSGLMAAGMRIVYGRLQGDANGLAPIFSRPILAFSAVWIVVNIVSGVLRLGVTDDLTLIAWVAHLGGYFAGLVMIGMFGQHALERHGLHAA
ncbi:MAG TPA: rhomboid family intramembrane serine protease [Micropepsaceae bacterium]|nr:rhomboid family intramembrane serine protease [Micropepsaceae bacterium]